MSFVSEITEQYSHEKKEFTIDELERGIAEEIVNQAKPHIKAAIRNGQVCICMKYAHNNDGGTNLWSMNTEEDTIEYYLNDDPCCYLYGLADVVDAFSHGEKKNFRNAVFQDEKKLNLTNIENYVRNGLLDLGVREACVYVRFCTTVHQNVWRKGLFGRGKMKRELCSLNKYKVCYEASW
jgi:hypothetical protein